MPLAIVTGANTGLGFETARGLLSQGFDVVITSRDQARGQLAVELLAQEFPSRSLSTLSLDLAQISSVDNFAKTFSSRFGNWDVLVNNAGAKVLANYSETDSGVEYHFGANAVGHFAITADLLPFRADTARVVSVASIVARFAPSEMGPSGSRGSYSPGASYAASKLSNLLFALELENRMGSDRFSSLAAHPGFARAQPYGPKSTKFFESFLAQSAASGALPIIAAAANADLSGGCYLVPKVLELWGKPKEARIPDVCTDKNLLENWITLEKLSGRDLTV
ncbi:unannotated protein [freshwater metagenome]|uniref:Unannotated protein n=1 Tax=freshwater metagenome TaxID=449393 RepID=A0A6J6ITL9_9ZZZZ|nr:SDR family NAD(P)-dependent oxidoreductase [Actinomycetota bacterium]